MSETITKLFKSLRPGQSFVHDGKRYKKVDKNIASRWDKEKTQERRGDLRARCLSHLHPEAEATE